MRVYYAVTRGRRPGVYESRAAYLAAIEGFASPTVRPFFTRHQAHAWFDAHYRRSKVHRLPARNRQGIGSAAHTATSAYFCAVADLAVGQFVYGVSNGNRQRVVVVTIDHGRVSATRIAAELSAAIAALERLKPGPVRDWPRVVIASAYIHGEFLPRRETYKKRQWITPIAERELCRRLSDLLDTRSVFLEAPGDTADREAVAELEKTLVISK